MSDAHILELPKSVWILKIVQIALSVFILALSAYVVYALPNSGSAFTIFTSLYTIIITIYYIVSLHAVRSLYNWIAILVLECFAVVWWLCAWATLAAYYVLFTSLVYCYGYYCDSYSYDGPGSILWKVSIILSVIQFIFYCITLGFIGMAVHRHRKAGKPFNAGGTIGTSNSSSAAEKNEMHNMPPQAAQPAAYGQPMPPQATHPASYAQSMPQYNVSPVQPAQPYEQQATSPASAYSQAGPYSQIQGGPTPEMYGGSRY